LGVKAAGRRDCVKRRWCECDGAGLVRRLRMRLEGMDMGACRRWWHDSGVKAGGGCNSLESTWRQRDDGEFGLIRSLGEEAWLDVVGDEAPSAKDLRPVGYVERPRGSGGG
jgi:hypothetical protein